MHLYDTKKEKYGSTVSRLENAGNVILSTVTWKSFYKAKQTPATSAGILNNLRGQGTRVGIGLSSRAARLHTQPGGIGFL
jgi:hypothetical protein